MTFVVTVECDRRNLLLTIVDRCDDNTCGMMPKSNRRRPSFLLLWRCSCIIFNFYVHSVCACI